MMNRYILCSIFITAIPYITLYSAEHQTIVVDYDKESVVATTKKKNRSTIDLALQLEHDVFSLYYHFPTKTIMVNRHTNPLPQYYMGFIDHPRKVVIKDNDTIMESEPRINEICYRAESILLLNRYPRIKNSALCAPYISASACELFEAYNMLLKKNSRFVINSSRPRSFFQHIAITFDNYPKEDPRRPVIQGKLNLISGIANPPFVAAGVKRVEIQCGSHITLEEAQSSEI